MGLCQLLRELFFLLHVALTLNLPRLPAMSEHSKCSKVHGSSTSHPRLRHKSKSAVSNVIPSLSAQKYRHLSKNCQTTKFDTAPHATKTHLNSKIIGMEKRLFCVLVLVLVLVLVVLVLVAVAVVVAVVSVGVVCVIVLVVVLSLVRVLALAGNTAVVVAVGLVVVVDLVVAVPVLVVLVVVVVLEVVVVVASVVVVGVVVVVVVVVVGGGGGGGGGVSVAVAGDGGGSGSAGDGDVNDGLLLLLLKPLSKPTTTPFWVLHVIINFLPLNLQPVNKRSSAKMPWPYWSVENDPAF